MREWKTDMKHKARQMGAALLLSLALLAAPVAAQGSARGLADTALAPASLAAFAAGEAALAQRNTQEAINQFEAALAADPRNLSAYVGMARAAETEGLPGKAIRFYREALAIDPNHQAVLEAQGNAYLARGARSRAEANLERLKTLCANDCANANRLAAAISRHDATASAPATAQTPATPQ